MKTEVKVWLAAANLHEQGEVPFRRQDLIAEVIRLFPASNRATVMSYVDAKANVTAEPVHSFAYLVRTSPGWYRLSRPGDANTLSKPRWPLMADVDDQYLSLWGRWSDWQQGKDLLVPR